MRILIFIATLGGGGAERVAVNLASYWSGAGHQVRVVTLRTANDGAYPLPPSVSRTALGLNHGGGAILHKLAANIRTIVALRREIRRFDCDVAVGMMTMANVQLACASVGLACGTVGSERTSPGHWRIPAPWRFLRWACYGFLDVVTAQTSGAGEWLKKHTRAKRVEVIPNAVVAPVEGDGVISPNDICPPDRRILLGVGRFTEEKRFDLLIEAFARIATARPLWDLVILGDGPDRSALEHLVKTLGLEERVRLPGRADNVSTWYRRASVFALTSRFEGFPNVLVEALAHGVPSVAVDCPHGPRDILKDNRGGLLVPMDDGDALVGAVERVMDDENLRAEMSRAAPAIQDSYRESTVMAKWSAALAIAHQAALDRGRRQVDAALAN